MSKSLNVTLESTTVRGTVSSVSVPAIMGIRTLTSRQVTLPLSTGEVMEPVMDMVPVRWPLTWAMSAGRKALATDTGKSDISTLMSVGCREPSGPFARVPLKAKALWPSMSSSAWADVLPVRSSPALNVPLKSATRRPS